MLSLARGSFRYNLDPKICRFANICKGFGEAVALGMTSWHRGNTHGISTFRLWLKKHLDFHESLHFPKLNISEAGWFERRRKTGNTLRAIFWEMRRLHFTTPGRIRTCDPRFRKPMLYPLSYGGEWPCTPPKCRRQDPKSLLLPHPTNSPDKVKSARYGHNRTPFCSRHQTRMNFQTPTGRQFIESLHSRRFTLVQIVQCRFSTFKWNPNRCQEFALCRVS